MAKNRSVFPPIIQKDRKLGVKRLGKSGEKRNIHKENSFILMYICAEMFMNDADIFYKDYECYGTMNITENIDRIVSTLPAGVRLIAVSKTKPAGDIEIAYAAGQRAFGENRPQEMAMKYQKLPKDIEWHMIGQLQEKNVKYIASFVSLIHSADSLKLLEKIDKEAAKNNRVIDCLLEFHIAQETTKAGLTLEDAVDLLESEAYAGLKHIRITGVMGIATFTENTEQVHDEFRRLKYIFDMLKQRFFSTKEEFRDLSMGMSDDYEIAVEEGSTIVRVGSAIFGARNYNPVI